MSAAPARATACRWCGRPLGALQQRNGDACGEAACRWRADRERRREQALHALQRCRDAAPARQRAGLAAAPVVWIQPLEAAQVELDDDERAEHLDFLMRVAAAPQDFTRDAVHAYPARAQRAHAADAPVCGLCAGRCCLLGRARHGFIDGPLLLRRAAAAGGSLAAAAAWYAARLPPRHVRHSCLYHGAQGCVLPRAARAPVCRGYACEALHDARAALATPGAGVLLAGWHPDAAGAMPQVAWLRAGARAERTPAAGGDAEARRRRGRPHPR
ncbi:MAG: hypothetical protein AMXMBFR66_10480 [Pseudomonadota bacterium]|nr:hypothetical protein [Rubrivivax sp.]NLZ40742.1 hypothetical protein [Comamonadaceae bacterium]